MNRKLIERIAKKIMEDLKVTFPPIGIELHADVTIYKWPGGLDCIATGEERFWKLQGRGYNEEAAVKTLKIWGQGLGE